MSVRNFIKLKILSKKFSRNQIYFLSSLLFILIVGVLVAVVAFGTIQRGKTQAKAEANSKAQPKFDPVEFSKQIVKNTEKSVMYEISYDPNSNTAQVTNSFYIPIDSFTATFDKADKSAESYSFELKLMDNNKKVLSDTWLNYKKSSIEKDEKTGRVKIFADVPEDQDITFEFNDKEGKNLVNKKINELPRPK